MTGLLYKELIQNRTNLLLLLLSISLPTFALIATAVEAEKNDAEFMAFTLLSTLMYTLVFYILDAFKINFLRVDESRKWADWIISSPKAADGYVYTKYVFIFLIDMAMVIYCYYLDMVLTTITGKTSGTILLLTVLFSVDLLLAALELPLMFRFSAKLGEKIGAVLFVAVLFALIVYALFGDLSMFGSLDDFYEWIIRLRDMMQEGSLPGGLYLFLGCFVCGSMLLYIASYHLSRRWYRKGARHYET